MSTETEYTAEPWRHTVGTTANEYIATGGEIDGEISVIVQGRDRVRKAQRIVACVNACAGMEDPATDMQRARDAANRLYNHCLIQEDDVGMGIASAILLALGG